LQSYLETFPASRSSASGNAADHAARNLPDPGSVSTWNDGRLCGGDRDPDAFSACTPAVALDEAQIAPEFSRVRWRLTSARRKGRFVITVRVHPHCCARSRKVWPAGWDYRTGTVFLEEATQTAGGLVVARLRNRKACGGLDSGLKHRRCEASARVLFGRIPEPWLNPRTISASAGSSNTFRLTFTAT